MKLLAILALVFSSSLVMAQSQITAPRPKRINPVLSQLTPEFFFTGSILDGEDTNEVDGQRTGVGAGARLDIGTGDLVFETGILYRQMGGVAHLYTPEEARKKGITNRLESEIELNYLSIPLMVKYFFNGRANSGFYTRTGLQPSFLIYREARLRDTNAMSVKDLSHINDFDLIGAVGMGFQIPLNDATFAVFEGTYLRGFTSVFDNTALYHNGFSGTFGIGLLL